MHMQFICILADNIFFLFAEVLRCNIWNLYLHPKQCRWILFTIRIGAARTIYWFSLVILGGYLPYLQSCLLDEGSQNESSSASLHVYANPDRCRKYEGEYSTAIKSTHHHWMQVHYETKLLHPPLPLPPCVQLHCGATPGKKHTSTYLSDIFIRCKIISKKYYISTSGGGGVGHSLSKTLRKSLA